MDNYFDSELNKIEREIKQLKTAQQKFAGQVPTIAKSVSISIPLSLNASQTAASGSAMYRITTTSDTYLMATLAKYYDDITLNTSYPVKTRSMILRLGKYNSNQYLILIYARGTGGSDSDVSTLKNGGSVTLTNTLTVRGTDEFSLEAI